MSLYSTTPGRSVGQRPFKAESLRFRENYWETTTTREGQYRGPVVCRLNSSKEGNGLFPFIDNTLGFNEFLCCANKVPNGEALLGGFACTSTGTRTYVNASSRHSKGKFTHDEGSCKRSRVIILSYVYVTFILGDYHVFGFNAEPKCFQTISPCGYNNQLMVLVSQMNGANGEYTGADDVDADKASDKHIECANRKRLVKEAKNHMHKKMTNEKTPLIRPTHPKTSNHSVARIPSYGGLDDINTGVVSFAHKDSDSGEEKSEHMDVSSASEATVTTRNDNFVPLYLLDQGFVGPIGDTLDGDSASLDLRREHIELVTAYRYNDSILDHWYATKSPRQAAVSIVTQTPSLSWYEWASEIVRDTCIYPLLHTFYAAEDAGTAGDEVSPTIWRTDHNTWTSRAGADYFIRGNIYADIEPLLYREFSNQKIGVVSVVNRMVFSFNSILTEKYPDHKVDDVVFSNTIIYCKWRISAHQLRLREMGGLVERPPTTPFS